MASPVTYAAPGPLGFIVPALRTRDQHEAHARALSRMPKFAIVGGSATDPPVGTKVMLTDFWKDALVVADVGMEFPGFHQLTGSCVGASEGNAVATTSFVQRRIAANPTRAMIPWWLFAYGRCRANEGDHGQGEGAVDSVMGETLSSEGIFDITQPGLPKFKTDDGMYLTAALEMQWSDGNSKLVMDARPLALAHTLTHAPLYDARSIRDAIINGYAVLYGCDKYVNGGAIKGSGANAYVVGRYDGNGGHSTCFLGYWSHPTDGPLYLYSNQWPTATYPKDPAGAGRCCVWLPESEVDLMFSRYGGGGGETMALSRLNYFPAEPAVLNWLA